MKKMRFVSILASVLCALFLLNACSGGGTASQSGTESKSSSAASQTGDPAELTIGFYINSSMPTDMDAVLDEINKILLEKANAKITDKVVLNYGNYLEQITLMLSGNETPGFKVDLHKKDLANVLECAHDVGAPVPMTASVQEILCWLHATGHGDSDHSAIYRYYRTLIGEE